ncbi:reprolysin-like metallopeptidase [Ferruginibacter sp.]
MKKTLLLTLLLAFFTTLGFSQTDKFWSSNSESRSSIITDKAVARLAFPKVFELFNLNLEPLRQELFTIVDNKAKHSTVISLPNAAGKLEQFEVVEASNFEPALQAKFPEIRAFSGRGITDKAASLKLSISPQGIQTMVFRTEKDNEFIEPYSKDHTVYAVYNSQREKGKLPWTCSTDDKQFASTLKGQLPSSNVVGSSAGELRTMRLAQSVTAEYSNYFGATSAAQVNLVLAAINNTLARCNGCYEKDLALHLNLIAASTNVIYYNPSTDPYSPAGTGAGGAWNGELQNTLTSVIGDANYDIGHLFGASGGGGNAGCIGCVCGSGKGSGFTSPADGIPMGDNFDIDYVVHEVGHQLGANHTFSFSLEGTGQNKEVGSGITIMAYAGITSYDVAPHSIDIYHATSINQIQNNLAVKTCPVTTNITANNATPVVGSLTNYTIPISTPFALTGSATDANPGDVLTYCWEQNDNSTVSGSNSVASPTKASGPNWLSFSPTLSPTRLFPKLSTILAGLNVTPPLPGGDAIANIEALSSVGRTLNFRLTVRDNHPYSSTTPLAVGQTAFADMVVTVSAAAGPFAVSSPNSNVSWCGGSTQTVTWDVNNTTAAPVSCANVKISLSTDGGNTFPTVLLASTANDGSEVVTLPNTPSATARIKVEAIGNIFFDISNTDFAITAAVPIVVTTQPLSPVICAGSNTSFTTAATGPTLTYQWQESTNGGTSWTNITNGGIYGGATTTTLALTGVTAGMNNNQYRAIISGTTSCGSATTSTATLTVNTAPAVTTQPAASTICTGSNTSFTSAATGTGISYQWQVSTNGGGTWTNIANGGVYSGATTATLTLTGATVALTTYQYRVVVSGTCAPAANSTAVTLTVIAPATVTTNPAAATAICSTGNTSFTVAGSSTVPLIYQWQVSTNGGTTWTNITNAAPYSGATSATLTITNVPLSFNSYRYQALLSNATCATPAVSTASVLTVNVLPTATITADKTDLQAGQTATITAATTPATGLNIAWYKDNVLIPGATSNTYTVSVNNLGVYKVVVTDQATGTCINQSNLITMAALPSNKLFVFPNPNDGQFKVTYYNSPGTTTTQGITVYDRMGRKVYDNVFPVTQEYQLHQIDLRRFSKGLYFVVLRDASGKKIKSAEVFVK